MNKLYSANEVLKDIETFEKVSLASPINGLENVYFHQLYSHIVRNCTYQDVHSKIMGFWSFIDNIIPNVDIIPYPIYSQHLYLYMVDSIPTNLLELYQAHAKLILKTNSSYAAELIMLRVEHPFYILVNTHQHATSYFKNVLSGIDQWILKST